MSAEYTRSGAKGSKDVEASYIRSPRNNTRNVYTKARKIQQSNYHKSRCFVWNISFNFYSLYFSWFIILRVDVFQIDLHLMP